MRVRGGEAVRCGGRGGVRRSRRRNGTGDGDGDRRGGAHNRCRGMAECSGRLGVVDGDAVDDEEEGEAAPANGLRRRRGGEIRRGRPGDGGVQWHRRRLGDGGAVVATGARGGGV